MVFGRNHSPSEQQESEWICCDTLAKRWECSPFYVMEILSTRELGCRNFDDWSYLTANVQSLSKLYAYRLDVEEWEIKNGDKIKKPPLVHQVYKDNQALNQRITELEQENAKLKLELESKPSNTPESKMAAPHKAAQANILQKWKNIYIPNMLKVAIAVTKYFVNNKDAPPRTRGELIDIAIKELIKPPQEGWNKDNNKEKEQKKDALAELIHSAAFDVLHKALPSEYIKRDSGVRKQS